MPKSWLGAGLQPPNLAGGALQPLNLGQEVVCGHHPLDSSLQHCRADLGTFWHPNPPQHFISPALIPHGALRVEQLLCPWQVLADQIQSWTCQKCWVFLKVGFLGNGKITRTQNLGTKNPIPVGFSEQGLGKLGLSSCKGGSTQSIYICTFP